jgi:LysR family transcriptional regulator, glycine cleavage system transcriptional activator
MPRLKSLRTELPAIAIVNEAVNDSVVNIPSGVDVAVRYGSGNFNDMVSYLLIEEVVVPVCHPDLLNSGREVLSPSDLTQFPFLFGRTSLPGEGFPSWEKWFRWAGLDASPLPVAIAFDHHLMTVQAALEGQGMALAKRSIVMTDLIRGNLVQPLDVAYPLAFSHFLVHRSESPWMECFGTLRLWFERELALSLRDIPTPPSLDNNDLDGPQATSPRTTRISE